MVIRLEEVVDIQWYKGGYYYFGRSRWNRTKSFTYNFGIGMAVSTFTKAICLPIDRVSFSLESLNASTNKTFQGIIKGCPVIRTLHPLSQIPSMGFMFCTNELFRSFVQDPKEHPPVSTFMCGAVAGMLANSICYPLEVSCVSLVVETARKSKNNGLVEGLEQRYIQGGRSYLYTAWQPALFVNALQSGLMFTVFELLKNRISKEERTIGSNFMAAFAASLVSSLVTLPFDASRREMIHQSCTLLEKNRKNFLQLMKQSHKHCIKHWPGVLGRVPTCSVALLLFDRYKKNFSINDE